jgi:hypothetical protein
MRIDYLNTKIWRDDTTCINMIRMKRACFFHLTSLFRDCGLLKDTINMCVEQQVTMFLNTVGHYNLRNRLIGTNFGKSGKQLVAISTKFFMQLVSYERN